MYQIIAILCLSHVEAHGCGADVTIIQTGRFYVGLEQCAEHATTYAYTVLTRPGWQGLLRAAFCEPVS